MPRISLLIYFCVAAGCSSPSKELTADYDNYKFDQQVIQRLPVYDSLAGVILENFPSFKKLINENDSYRSYRYMPVSDDSDLSKKLPQQGAAKINQYFTALGTNFIYGFDVFKDSTIKIYIRKSFSKKDKVDIGENLSWYPPGSNIRRREFPVKDTILNKNWQYWIWFDKRNVVDNLF